MNTTKKLACLALLIIAHSQNVFAVITVSPKPGNEPVCCLSNGSCTISVSVSLDISPGSSGSISIEGTWDDAPDPKVATSEVSSEGKAKTITLQYTATVSNPDMYYVWITINGESTGLHFPVVGFPEAGYISFDNATAPNQLNTFCGKNNTVRFHASTYPIKNCDACKPQWSNNVKSDPDSVDDCFSSEGTFGGKDIHHVSASVGNTSATISFFTSDPQAVFTGTPTHVKDGCDVAVNVNINGGWSPYKVEFWFPSHDPRRDPNSGIFNHEYEMVPGSNVVGGGDGDYQFRQQIRKANMPSHSRIYDTWPLYTTMTAMSDQRTWIENNVFNQDTPNPLTTADPPIVVFSNPTNSPFATRYTFIVSVTDAKGCRAAEAKHIWAHPEIEIDTVTRDQLVTDCNPANWKFPLQQGNTHFWTASSRYCFSTNTTIAYGINVNLSGGGSISGLKSAVGVTGNLSLSHTFGVQNCYQPLPQNLGKPHTLAVVPTKRHFEGTYLGYSCGPKGTITSGTFQVAEVSSITEAWVVDGGTHPSCSSTTISATNGTLPSPPLSDVSGE